MSRIRAVVMDVDGVLTDGTFWWGAGGEEFRRFSFADVMGISLGRKAGLIFGLISGEDTPLIDRFAEKMQIVDVYKGCKDKAAALRDIAARHRLDASEVCYVGDDVNDLPAFKFAGLKVAPANAHASVLACADTVLRRNGGSGAVRELIDLLISRQTPAAGD